MGIGPRGKRRSSTDAKPRHLLIESSRFLRSIFCDLLLAFPPFNVYCPLCFLFVVSKAINSACFRDSAASGVCLSVRRMQSQRIDQFFILNHAIAVKCVQKVFHSITVKGDNGMEHYVFRSNISLIHTYCTLHYSLLLSPRAQRPFQSNTGMIPKFCHRYCFIT